MENKHVLIITILIIFGGILFVNLSASKQKTSTRTNANTTQKQSTPTDTASQEKNETENPYTDGISLQITTPQNNQTVTASSITVSGKTAPGAEVFINDMEIRANGSGQFSTQITLDEGENSIFVIVNDQEGNSAEKELIVTYQAE